MAERRSDAAAVVLLGPETQYAGVERHLREGVRLGVDPDAQVGCDEVELVRGRDRMRGRFRLRVRARARFTVRVRVTLTPTLTLTLTLTLTMLKASERFWSPMESGAVGQTSIVAVTSVGTVSVLSL